MHRGLVEVTEEDLPSTSVPLELFTKTLSYLSGLALPGSEKSAADS